MKKKKDLLKRKYYCQAVNETTVDVVMEIKTGKIERQTFVPSRYVLVLDVSGSMDGCVDEENPETLLDRVKVFSRLVIENIDSRDSLGIVTFANDVQVDMPVTLMDRKGKRFAKAVVQSIQSRGATNLEAGLMEGLDTLESDKASSGTRDLIILFTDGIANEGETDADKLVQEYRDAQEGFRQFVPLSAFTIGEYDPALLKELAFRLGSDAFYWLNKGREFEADMLLPIILRDDTHITDINIEMEALDDVTFSDDHISQTHLLKCSSSKLNYLIHGISKSLVKHIPVRLTLPEGKFEEMKGNDILQVDGTYVDNHMKKRSFADHVILVNSVDGSKTVKVARTGEIMIEDGGFIIENDRVKATENVSRQALLVIAEEYYRNVTVAAFDKVAQCLQQNDSDLLNQHHKIIKDAVLEVNMVKRRYLTMMPDDTVETTILMDRADAWITNLDSARLTIDPDDIGRVYAMQSSLVKEMPPARGVFDDQQNQPYMNWKLRNELRNIDDKVKKTKKEKQIFVTANVFEGKTLILSERLRCKRLGWKRETFGDLIVRCGGGIGYDIETCPYDSQPGWYVQKEFKETYLICSKQDYQKTTYLVKQAKDAQVPILKKDFVFKCIKNKKFLPIEEFIFERRKK